MSPWRNFSTQGGMRQCCSPWTLRDLLKRKSLICSGGSQRRRQIRDNRQRQPGSAQVTEQQGCGTPLVWTQSTGWAQAAVAISRIPTSFIESFRSEEPSQLTQHTPTCPRSSVPHFCGSGTPPGDPTSPLSTLFQCTSTLWDKFLLTSNLLFGNSRNCILLPASHICPGREPSPLSPARPAIPTRYFPPSFIPHPW